MVRKQIASCSPVGRHSSCGDGKCGGGPGLCDTGGGGAQGKLRQLFKKSRRKKVLSLKNKLEHVGFYTEARKRNTMTVKMRMEVRRQVEEREARSKQASSHRQHPCFWTGLSRGPGRVGSPVTLQLLSLSVPNTYKLTCSKTSTKLLHGNGSVSVC